MFYKEFLEGGGAWCGCIEGDLNGIFDEAKKESLAFIDKLYTNIAEHLDCEEVEEWEDNPDVLPDPDDCDAVFLERNAGKNDQIKQNKALKEKLLS